jgi:hypothetical protein
VSLARAPGFQPALKNKRKPAANPAKSASSQAPAEDDANAASDQGVMRPRGYRSATRPEPLHRRRSFNERRTQQAADGGEVGLKRGSAA